MRAGRGGPDEAYPPARARRKVLGLLEMDTMRALLCLLGTMGAVVGLAAASGCGGAGSTTSSSSTTGGTGGATSTTTSTTGAGGTGGGAGGGAGAPFTSKGASSYEAQTSLAADGKGGVLASWIAFFTDGSSAIGYTVSRDGGETWTAPAYAKSPDGRLASNPVVAVDGQGRFSLAWLGFRPDALTPDEHVYVARLDAASETFGAPVVASDDGSATNRDFDKPALAVDANDNLLLTWADFTGASGGTPPSLTFARSIDGTSFTRTTVVADASFGNLAALCLDSSAGPAAPLYLVHLGAGATVTLRRSVDQGKTWAPLAVPATSVVFQDITCAAHGSDLWITYASGTAVFSPSQDSPGDAVSVVHSATGGDAFDQPVTVSNGGAGAQYLFPQIARSPAGDLLVAYYQGKVDGPVKLMVASSKTGAAWTSAALGTAGNFTVDRTLASWLGDYLGLASTAAGTFASYTENSAGKAHVAFAKSPVIN